MNNEKLFSVSPAPHIHGPESTSKIMWTVSLALLPAAVLAVWMFRLPAFILIMVGIGSAVLTELGYQLIAKQKPSIQDGSAFLTGLLLAFNLPPDAPWWLAAVGSAFAIIIVKQLFGGLGYNIFNPALAGRAFLLASWPVYMTTRWIQPQLKGTVFTVSGLGNSQAANLINQYGKDTVNALTSATPLAAITQATPQMESIFLNKNYLLNLLIGNVGGVIGETSAILLLLGGLFLMWRGYISYHIPVSFILTVFIIMSLVSLFSESGFNIYFPLFHILAGGLFLGAFFMATDMVTSPMTPKAMLIFGVGCGLITSIIRLVGGYPEGVSYSILLMNATVPLLDRFLKNKKFGTVK
jgi:electron transport complex protein RnfD